MRDALIVAHEFLKRLIDGEDDFTLSLPDSDERIRFSGKFVHAVPKDFPKEEVYLNAEDVVSNLAHLIKLHIPSGSFVLKSDDWICLFEFHVTEKVI